MEVILLEKIVNLGDLGDQVTVKAGFGRNYLIPQNKAVPATKDNVAEFEARRAELERQEKERLAEAQQRAEQVNGLDVTITVKAGDEGKLFGSVTVRDIVEAAEKRGVTIDASEVFLPEGPIRALGEYEIDVQLHAELVVTMKVGVIAEV
ncbi:MAG: 50S ribosomal protein L9 [Gammaproteobacteria bacterium]|nr:50S ribosomal protein L9 [Gammaproteobacteria bacterium]